jgi:hypothetical protein
MIVGKLEMLLAASGRKTGAQHSLWQRILPGR